MLVTQCWGISLSPFHCGGCRILTTNVDYHAERIKKNTMATDPENIGIQLKRIELMTFMMISSCKNPLVSMVYINKFNPYSAGIDLQRGDRLPSSESDVSRRQILTTKVNPCTVRVKIFIIGVDP